MSIELFLNVCWLVAAIAAVGYWCIQAKRSDEKSIKGLRSFVALACALVVLFPAISLTDDLYVCQMMANPHQGDLISLVEFTKSKLILFAVAVVNSLMLLLFARVIWLIRPELLRTVPSVIWLREFTNRPPPASALSLRFV